jgi:D-alanyl-D-alanine carboxypeptidase/D-alanyl-D-alanine-endopeptidase (penicillin-binding protein 4)
MGMPGRIRVGRWAVAAALGASWLPCAGAADGPALPPEVRQALREAQVPESALGVVIEEVGSGRRLLAWNEQTPVNPASLAKLVTTFAALDTLGPAWRWRTPVWMTGERRDGVLDGSLVIQGSGDPTLVLERVWLLLHQVRQRGVREIRGDIVLDRSAFDLPDVDPGEFDGEPLRPYNTRPDALLLNYKSVTYGFVPEPAAGYARVTRTPLLEGAAADLTVPLSTGPCGDWRGALKASFEPPGGARFAGAYAASCGERAWPVADPDPATYNARLLAGLWRGMGGTLTGTVRDGAAPAGRAPDFVVESPSLAEAVRDINKFSNNVMARLLFLSLASQGRTPPAGATASPPLGAGPAPVTEASARARLADWLVARAGPGAAEDVVLDNGAGLSRQTRLRPALLARLLQLAWSSPVMPELMASLPASGLDGTLRRSTVPPGRAHLKTGSLRNVAGVAGYVLADDGRRYVVVAIVNHPNANATRGALDALARWALAEPAAR